MTTAYDLRTGPGLTPEGYAAANAVQTLARRFQGVLLGWIAFRAGRNHYDLTAQLDDAILRGAEALRRWWIWLFFTKVWLFTLAITMWITYMEHHTIRGDSFHDYGGLGNWSTVSWWLLPFTFVLGVLLPYCRNVDYSLFKRRSVYRLLRPVTVALNKLPVGVLYLTVLIGLFHW